MIVGNDSNTLYVGGYMFSLAGQYCENFGSYDVRTRKWTCLTTSQYTYVNIKSLYYHPFTNSIIVGGATNFAPNGTQCGGICIYNQTRWYPSGGAFNNSVNSITGNPNNNNWYACGEFTGVNSIAANYIVMWNGNQFVAMGQGFDNVCYAVAFDSSTGRVYAGGAFAYSGVSTIPYLAFWNGASWAKPVVSPVPDNAVYSIALLGGGSFVFGGLFENIGGIVAK